MKRGFTGFVLAIACIMLYSCKSTRGVEPTIPAAIETPKEEPKEEVVANFLSEYLKLKYKDRSFKKYMYVSVKHQRLYLIENDSTIRKYPISTAEKGMGCKRNSYKTPPGLHTIKTKIGDNVPKGGIFESRLYNGKIAKIITDDARADGDYVTSRIMWLQGEEPGVNRGRNVDSYNRYIYIHGTAEEGRIGRPASHGCIRMKNDDVIELYDLVDEGTPILILRY